MPGPVRDPKGPDWEKLHEEVGEPIYQLTAGRKTIPPDTYKELFFRAMPLLNGWFEFVGAVVNHCPAELEHWDPATDPRWNKEWGDTW